MSEAAHAPTADARSIRADRLAGPMFFLSLVFLVVLAGLIHRYPRIDPEGPEARVIIGTLGGVWLVFFVEAAIRFQLRERGRPMWRSLTAAVACALVPPMRMGCRGRVRPDHIWLPTVGWRRIDNHLRREMERFFSVPMILFALMVLPLFVLEYYWAAEVHAHPWLALGVDIGSSAIWLAFTIELVLMVSVSDRPVRYCFVHWIDVAIVVLPAFEELPLLRVLRLGRVLRLDELLRLGRLYRLRALAARGWRAVLLLQIVHRLTGRSLENRRRRLRELILAKEEELAELRQEMVELDARVERKNPARTESETVGVRMSVNLREDEKATATEP
jgi:voltage-gated potassium channel